MGGDTHESCPCSVVVVALATLCHARGNRERNRDSFIYSNMAQVRLSLLEVALAKAVGVLAEAALEFGVTPDLALNSTSTSIAGVLLQCRKAI